MIMMMMMMMMMMMDGAYANDGWRIAKIIISTT